jgi:NADPH2:quinone reductase
MLSQVARYNGFKTIGTARSEEKKNFALSHGFDVILDANPETLVEQVMSVTGNLGVNLVYDHLGGAIFPACIRSLSPLGLAISYNIITGKPDTDVFGLLRELLGKSLGVRCFSMHTFDEDKDSRRSMMGRAIELMSNGHVKAPSALVMSLSQVAQAHEILDQGLTLGKIVLNPH